MKNPFEHLSENDCIACPTQEIFNEIIGMNPNNTVKLKVWEEYKEQTVYYPKDRNSKGSIGRLSTAQENNFTIHPHTDFIKPKLVRGMWGYINKKHTEKRIFLAYIEGARYPYILVSVNSEPEFNNNEPFSTASHNYFHPITTREISIEEAEEKLKELTGEEVKICKK